MSLKSLTFHLNAVEPEGCRERNLNSSKVGTFQIIPIKGLKKSLIYGVPLSLIYGMKIRAIFISARDWARKKTGVQNKSALQMEKQPETLLFVTYYLKKTCGFFQCNFIENSLQWDYCGLNLVLMSQTWCFSNKNFYASYAFV